MKSELLEAIKAKMPELQEALDNSPYAEEAGACIPIDNVITAILAIYYYLNKEEVEAEPEQSPNPDKINEVDVEPEQTPNPDAGSDDEGSGIGEVEDPASCDWMKSHYWKSRILSDDNGDRINKKKGFSPFNCDFWTSEKDTDGLYNVEGETFYTKKVSEMFDYGGSSHKVFNRIHMYKDDPNFSIGYLHMASGRERKFFVNNIISNEIIFKEMCQYLVYRLNIDKCTDTDKDKDISKYAPLYRLQAANDVEIKKVLFKDREDNISADEVEKVTVNEWMAAIQRFFSTKGVLKAGEYTCPLSKKSKRSYFAQWAESQMKDYAQKENIKDYIDPKTHTVVEYLTQNFEGGVGALLFETVDDNPLTCVRKFWFHDIFKDALLLKSIAAEQIKFWKNEFYPVIVKNSKKILGAHPEQIPHNSFLVYGVLSLANWANHATDLTLDVTFNEESKDLEFKAGKKEISISGDKFITNKSDLSEDKLKGIILLSCIRYEMYEGKKSNRSRTRYIIKNHLKKYWEITAQMSKDTDRSDPPKEIEKGKEYIPLHENNHLEEQMLNCIRRIGLELNK